ncbi:Carnitine O-palmitoyltransferase 1, muscle isoform [Melipona quadrifasciata]|uniref:Carnitine O-palmitoyltransferase 1, muscle isoform n=1 Tax=Melipona quadrifasciata TaxID=166423 RepID=A0A0N0BKU0_9HYME|nr:Carnitine O-palmitoyltransferase 1, muscle isoform [Melipona quadrifasciata]
MAEAHSAVAFSFSITHEGWDVNFDREVLHLNNLRSGVYPASLESLWFTIAVVTAIHFAGYKVPYDLVGKAAPYLPGSSVLAHLAGSFIVGLFLWLVVIYVLRYTLKLLLMYKGWMYESREKGANASRISKIWSTLVKLFFGWHKPMLYSFQGSLPRLPLPSVEDTMKRYLRSVRPLLDDENYSRMETLANEFQKGIGAKLQRYLILKSWWATNYVSDWWEEYVYLRGRSPIMVNSNFYGIDAILMYPSHVQVARAASAIYSCLQYRRLIERQELEPVWYLSVHGNMKDYLIQQGYQDVKRTKLQMQQILDDKSEPSEGEEKLAALTAGERTAWAIAREEFFSKGVNKISLDLIEKAAFIVALDDIPYIYDPENPDKLDQYGRILLHGKGYDRWFDKSFTLCIGSNGRTGFNAEHSWADAAVMSHLWEYVISQEITNREADAPIMGSLWEYVVANDVEMGYKEDGYNKGESEFTPPPPVRLQWDLNPDCIAAIEESNQVAQNLLNDVELRIYVHNAYGKGFMKINSMSPDAYIQMALQLAYFRDSGKFNLTYEASMTRLFREGRTETVRPCTIESTNWVKAMESKNATSDKLF